MDDTKPEDTTSLLVTPQSKRKSTNQSTNIPSTSKKAKVVPKYSAKLAAKNLKLEDPVEDLPPKVETPKSSAKLAAKKLNLEDPVKDLSPKDETPGKTSLSIVSSEEIRNSDSESDDNFELNKISRKPNKKIEDSDDDDEDDIAQLNSKKMGLIFTIIKAANGNHYTDMALTSDEPREPGQQTLKRTLYNFAGEKFPDSYESGFTCFLAAEFGLSFACITKDEEPDKPYKFSSTKPNGRFSSKFLKKLSTTQHNFMMVRKNKLEELDFSEPDVRDKYAAAFVTRLKNRVEISFKCSALR